MLGVAADASALQALPALPLEDGDRFYVPPLPSTVAVVGEVYNRHGAFAFDQASRLAITWHWPAVPPSRLTTARCM